MEPKQIVPPGGRYFEIKYGRQNEQVSPCGFNIKLYQSAATLEFKMAAVVLILFKIS